MKRTLAATTAALFCLAAVAAPSPVRADPWWFLAGAVFSMVTAPAFSYPYGYRSGYAPAAPVAPWAAGPEPQHCHMARIQHNGAWRQARICYDRTAGEAGPSETIVRKY